MSYIKKYIIDLALFLAFFYAILYFLYDSGRSLAYNWQWHRVIPFFYALDEGELFGGVFYDGLLITLQIAALSFLLAIGIGFMVMLMSQSKRLILRTANILHVEIVRNTPLLIQLYLIYFILGPSLGWEAITCGIVALAIFESAYIAEILRSGVQSVAKEQWEGGYSLGLSTFHLYLFIVMPQAIRIVLPPMTSVLINLVKHSSIVSVIAIADLTTEARNAVSDTFLSFEVWLSVACVYVAVTLSISLGMGIVERLLLHDTR